MPAHEETQQVMAEPCVELSESPEPKLDEPAEESDEGCAMENPTNFATLPNKDTHEQFIRDALEIILRDAVFEVSSTLLLN